MKAHKTANRRQRSAASTMIPRVVVRVQAEASKAAISGIPKTANPYKTQPLRSIWAEEYRAARNGEWR